MSDLPRTIAGRRETVGEALERELGVLRPLPAVPFDAARPPACGWTPRRWSPIARTATPSRWPWSDVGWQPGSARARSRSATTGWRSPVASGWMAVLAARPNSITTSSCWRSTPARSPGRCRCARSATAAPGPLAPRWFGQFQGAGGRRVDALVPVVPADSIPGMGVVSHNLLHHTTAGGAVGRPRLDEDMISRRESHDRPFVDFAPRVARAVHTVEPT
jgi:hypothetical protein